MLHKERRVNKTGRHIRHLLSLVFFLSGVSALIYQIVWQRLLATYYGVGPISIALIVSLYMAGLGLGALYGGYLSERLRQKIVGYCIIELCIGLFGLASPSFLQFLGRYTAGSSYTLSFLYMMAFLFIPTFLMGMTLPLLTKTFSLLTKSFVASVSFLYFINTIGAAFGALVASYGLISFFGLEAAVYFAAGVSFLIALIIYVSLRLSTAGAAVQVTTTNAEPRVTLGWVVYPLVFLTGFLAIGYEITWFRVVGVLVKDSAYVFSSVLAVYLTGIACGSYAMKRFLSRHPGADAKSLFFSLQFLIGLMVGLTFLGYFYLTKHTILFQTFNDLSFRTRLHPGWYFESRDFFGILKGAFRAFDVFFWSTAFVLVPTLLMGASFPLVASLALKREDQQGKTVALVYFFTIVGNALGGIATGFFILPMLGTEFTVTVFAATGIMFGLSVPRLGRMKILPPLRGAIVAIVVAGFVGFFPRKGELYQVMHVSPGEGYEYFFEEGVDGTVATFKRGESIRNYINGVAHGGRPINLFYCETIEAMSRAPTIQSVLVIGYGTGSTVETLLKSNEVKEIVVVELNRTLLINLRKISLFDEMLKDPRINLIIDDGRRYLFNSSKKFDMITADPLWSSTSYSNNLYSQDFFRLVQSHLKPNGVFMAWQDEHRVIPKTVASVFAHVDLYRDFTIASDLPMSVDHVRREKLLNQFSPVDRELIVENSVHIGDRTYVESITAGYPINREWEPRVEYYLGLGYLEWKLGPGQ
jgi:predicted membrane-bound spermidine synthase